MVRKTSKTSHQTLSELNITPLLDLAFVLLVIFVLTTAPPMTEDPINLAEEIATMRKADSNLTFTVRGDAKAPFKQVREALNAIQRANVLKVKLATKPDAGK